MSARHWLSVRSGTLNVRAAGVPAANVTTKTATSIFVSSHIALGLVMMVIVPASRRTLIHGRGGRG